MYTQAVEQYTEALFCDIPDNKKSIYLCNRSLTSLRLEENQLALFDAVEAIKKDANNVKGYYRKGQAQAALNQMKLAVQCFKTVCQMQPQNRDARAKYELTMKAFKEAELAKAIFFDEKKVEVDVGNIQVEASYTGPRLESIDDLNAEWVVSMM